MKQHLFTMARACVSKLLWMVEGLFVIGRPTSKERVSPLASMVSTMHDIPTSSSLTSCLLLSGVGLTWESHGGTSYHKLMTKQDRHHHLQLFGNLLPFVLIKTLTLCKLRRFIMSSFIGIDYLDWLSWAGFLLGVFVTWWPLHTRDWEAPIKAWYCGKLLVWLWSRLCGSKEMLEFLRLR